MSQQATTTRKIIHIDMDAFYASVEQRDNPELSGMPIVVGGSPQGRGVVATASYEARRYGVRSAMSSRRALQLCPELTFVKPRFTVYKEVSQKIRAIFRTYSDIIEPLSLDEAYIDVSEDKQGIRSAIRIAQLIKKSIKEELQLTASAGVSVNKFIAKIASDMNKPDGLTFIAPHEVEAFMEQLPVEKFFGVGKVTADKMKHMRLYTGGDLKKLTEDELVQHFGKSGHFFYKIVRGIDNRPVQPYREIKSVGAEDTFPEDLSLLEDMNTQLHKITVRVIERLQRNELQGRTLTLKIKYSDFRQVTRNTTIAVDNNTLEGIYQASTHLLAKHLEQDSKVRLLGISIANFKKNEETTGENIIQLKLF